MNIQVFINKLNILQCTSLTIYYNKTMRNMFLPHTKLFVRLPPSLIGP